MSTVGPQLPPHLSKRKRSIEDDVRGPGSPPRKLQAASTPQKIDRATPPSNNPDELNVDDSSDDGYGPSLVTTNASHKTVGTSLPTRAVGPSLPPSINPDELDVDDSSEDDYGPSLGPSKALKRLSKPSPPPQKRVLGPAPPPASLSEMPTHAANDKSDSDSDDDYGPSLPPAPGSLAESRMFAEREQEEERAAQIQATAKPKRDDWMLVPPSDSDWSSRIDPTKLKNRKFASGKGSKAPIDKSGGISAIWTETPEEKRKRLEDEVLGRRDAATSSRGGAAQGHSGKVDKDEEETSRRIKEYNEKNRSRTLYEEHKGQTSREKEDDPSKRGFDREKDMALGGRLGHAQKKEMLAKAADFGSRFQKGKYL